MKMMNSLILVVGTMLVGQSMAASVPEVRSMIKRPEPTEQLDKDQLLAKLSVKDLSEEHKGEVAEYVAEQLYAAKEKATTEVFEEMTVQDLIDLNQADLTSCSVKSLQERDWKFTEIYESDHHDRPFDLVFGIVTYMMKANLKTFEYCARNREEVVSQGIATMAELKEFFKFHDLVGPAKEGAAEDEFGDMPDFKPQLIESSGMIHAEDLFAPYSGALINHPPKSSKLDKEQLIAKLSVPNLHQQHRGGVAEYVAEQLYSAKNKATTEVLEGVTVGSLIEMNIVNLSSCTKGAMDKMRSKLDQLSKISPEGKPYELVFGINVFAKQAHLAVAEYCIAYLHDLIIRDYIEVEEMDKFQEQLKSVRKSDRIDDIEGMYAMGSLVTTTVEKFEDDVAVEMNKLFQ